MSFGKDQSIAGRIPGMLQVQAHLMEEQHRHYLSQRGTGRGMTRLGRLRGGDRVDPQLLGHVLQVLQHLTVQLGVRHFHNRILTTFEIPTKD